MTSQDNAKKSDAQEPDEIIEPLDIVLSAYKSLDKQIDEIDKIPGRVQEESDVLLGIVYDDNKDILQNSADALAFVKALQKLNSEIGHTWHALLMMEREEVKPEKDTFQMSQLPNVRPSGTAQQGPIIMGQPTVVKRGVFADFWEHLTDRRWAGAYEHALDVQNRQPDITTSKVKNVKDYGQELEAEWQQLLDFHTRAQCLVRHRKDDNTIRNLLREIRVQCVKLTQITKAFSTTIVEYRKDKFGDRKVAVAAGAMYLEAAKYAGQRTYISPFSPPSQPLGRRSNE